MAESQPILLFDGVCNFCNDTVNFVLDHDRAGRFRFAALQSEVGQRLLAEHGLRELPALSTSVLIHGGRAYTDSDAVLRGAVLLGGAFRLLAIFLLVPRFLRDPPYRLFCRYRYRWFGRSEQCRVPTPETRARFLEDP